MIEEEIEQLLAELDTVDLESIPETECLQCGGNPDTCGYPYCSRS